MKLRVICWIVLVAVLALGAPAWADKVTICHEPGNPTNSHTISVNEDSVQDHLDHGDTLGACAGATCPCFTAEDLLVITAENFFGYPLYCTYQKDGHVAIRNLSLVPLFYARFEKPYACSGIVDAFPITRDESDVCLLQIVDRCEAIGYPVIKP